MIAERGDTPVGTAAKGLPWWRRCPRRWVALLAGGTPSCASRWSVHTHQPSRSPWVRRRPRCSSWDCCRTSPAHSPPTSCLTGEQGAVMFPPRAADLALSDVHTALVHGAVGDYADEAAVLLLINFGHWLPQL